MYQCVVRRVCFWNLFYVKIIFVLFVFVHCVAAQDIKNDNKTLNTNNPNITTDSNGISCGDTQKMVDKCFTDLPPQLMEFLTTPKIAVHAEEINSKCTVFDRGMQCFDEYTKHCLSETKLNIIQNNVEGARNFFLKFCTDPLFQRDYLRHRECLSHIQDDWDRCTKEFQGILSDEIHEDRTNVTNKFMEFCCARYAFENCIYNSARYKCYQHSVTFARETAKMLSDEKHFSSCRQYEAALCLSNKVGSLWSNQFWYLSLCANILIIMLRS